VPVTLLDFLHYSWVADGQKARDQLGFVPRYASHEAAATLRGS
jgi:UDP-glucose 4-epimerase